MFTQSLLIPSVRNKENDMKSSVVVFTVKGCENIIYGLALPLKLIGLLTVDRSEYIAASANWHLNFLSLSVCVFFLMYCYFIDVCHCSNIPHHQKELNIMKIRFLVRTCKISTHSSADITKKLQTHSEPATMVLFDKPVLLNVTVHLWLLLHFVSGLVCVYVQFYSKQ